MQVLESDVMFPSINYARVAVIVSCSFLLLILSLQALPSNASHGLVWVVYLTKWKSSEDRADGRTA